MKAHIKRYNRCTWMAIVGAVFMVMTLALIIPGALGVGGLNRYNDTLLYLALVDSLFGILFLVGWFMCQFEVDDLPPKSNHIHLKKTNAKLSTYGSIRSTYSSRSSGSYIEHSLGSADAIVIEKNA